MTLARKIRIFIISIISLAVLTTAFLAPVSYSKWNAGLSSVNVETQVGNWGVSVVFPDKEYDTLFLAYNKPDKGQSTYDGAISVAASTRIQVAAAGVPLSSYPYKTATSSAQDNSDVTLDGDVYTLQNSGNYRITYIVNDKKLVIMYLAGDQSIDDIFNTPAQSAEEQKKKDQALMDMLAENGMSSSLPGGVRGCVTSSGTIVKIDDDGAFKWKTVLTLDAGEKVALFGKPAFSSTVKITTYASGVPQEQRDLFKLDEQTGYFEARQAGVYTVTITGGWSDFEISGITLS